MISGSDLVKMKKYVKVVREAFISAGVRQFIEAEDILAWAVGEDWKNLMPQLWPERIRERVSLCVNPHDPVKMTVRALVKLYQSKRKLTFGPHLN